MVATRVQSITTNLTKRSQFFHLSLNKLNFLQLRSTKLSVFKLNSSAFQFTLRTNLPLALQTTRAGHVFNLLCNQSLLSFSLSDGFTEVLFPVVNISISKIVYIQVYSRKQLVSMQKRVQKVKHTYANSLRHGLKIIRKQLVDFASTFAEVSI